MGESLQKAIQRALDEQRLSTGAGKRVGKELQTLEPSGDWDDLIRYGYNRYPAIPRHLFHRMQKNGLYDRRKDGAPFICWKKINERRYLTIRYHGDTFQVI